jgi:hypothetical protein
MMQFCSGQPMQFLSGVDTAVRNHRNAVRLALESVSALHRIPHLYGLDDLDGFALLAYARVRHQCTHAARFPTLRLYSLS